MSRAMGSPKGAKVDLEIVCRRCHSAWLIPGTLTQDQLLGLAQDAAHHKCKPVLP